jgi:predicted lysophospholipase L1 biosynthesis ABC-type transport system permease subunit
MSYQLDRLMVISLAVLLLLCLIGAGAAIAASVIHRSTQLAREVATRRILGARRSHIVQMFVLDNLIAILVGSLAGGSVLLVIGTWPDLPAAKSLLSSIVLVICAGVAGGWMAGRYAARTPFSKSGLFHSAPDKRGE